MGRWSKEPRILSSKRDEGLLYFEIRSFSPFWFNERERDRLLMLDGRGVTTLSNLNNLARVGV